MYNQLKVNKIHLQIYTSQSLRPIINISITVSQVDRVVCAVATALTNLAIDQRNKELIGNIM